MSVEDFTTYDLDDINTTLSRTATKVSWSALDRAVGVRLKDDKGAGHFGDFEHLITICCETSQAGSAYVHHWGLANTASIEYTSYPQLSILVERHSTGNYYTITLVERDDSNNLQVDAHLNYPIDAIRYLTIERNGTDLTCKIYTDSDRTSLDDTLALANVTETTFRYIYAVFSLGGGTGDWNMAGYSENLDLQEVPSGWGGEYCGVAVSEFDGVIPNEIDGV